MSDICCLTAVQSVVTLGRGIICLDLHSRISELMPSDKHNLKEKAFSYSKKCRVRGLAVDSEISRTQVRMTAEEHSDNS